MDMTTDLWMLTATAVFSLVWMMFYAASRGLQPGGLNFGIGNRDRSIELPPWIARAIRAHQNLIENIGPFAILVLVAYVTGKANETTALGATLFFYARIAHAVSYTAGILYVRTLVFFVGLGGEVMIVLQLCK
jgi:uncharacterized MAPEG superfamily protein